MGGIFKIWAHYFSPAIVGRPTSGKNKCLCKYCPEWEFTIKQSSPYLPLSYFEQIKFVNYLYSTSVNINIYRIISIFTKLNKFK